MSNLLQQIANPRIADPVGAYNTSYDQAQNRKAFQQQQARKTQEYKQAQALGLQKAMSRDLLLAKTSGPGVAREEALKNLMTTSANSPKFNNIFKNILETPEGPERSKKLDYLVDYAQQAGFLPKTTATGKSPEQLEREYALKERGFGLEEKRLGIREQEMLKETPGAISSLGKLIKERDALDPSRTEDRASYDARIAALIAKKGNTVINSQAKNLAKQVVEGRLDPNRVSKRGGLQQTVFSLIEDQHPGTNLVELEANARFKNTAANLQSRALINGVQPLYDSLLASGETLHNTKYPLINKAVNFAKEQTGDPDIVAFNNLRDDVIAETERILLGSGVLSDTKYTRALKNVNSAQSFPQLKAAVAQLELVVETRLEALDDEPYKKAGKKKEASNNDPLGIR